MTDKCPVRHLCMMTTHVKGDRLESRIVQKPRSETGIPCGFEQAGTVDACPKRQKLGTGPVTVNNGGTPEGVM